MLGPYYESVYRQLNHDKKEVRFLKIWRTSQSDGSGTSIECTLCTESLETDVEFEAISYVWGDPHDTKTITVDGYSFAVTRNAFEVLHMLPAKYASLPYLWIDAICIKQDDNMEKNYQVPLMGDIYRQARNVHIWLGPTVSSEDVFQSVLDRMDAEESLDSVFADTTFYQIYDDILPCSWWDRLWVVQEALLASNATFHIGRITVSWYHMRALCKHLCEILVGGFGHVDELEGPIGVFMQVSNIVTLFAYHSGSNVIPLDGKSIFRILKLMNGKLVTDERDRVYGTMALLPPELSIRPSYDSSVATIYRDFALTIMKCWQTLHLLTFCKQPLAEPTWPSWVPQFPNVSAGSGAPACNASMGASFFLGEINASSIAVRAHTVGQVAKVGETLEGASTHTGPLARRLEHVRQHLSAWRRLTCSASDSVDQRSLSYSRFWKILLTHIHLVRPRKQEPEAWAQLRDLDDWLDNRSSDQSLCVKLIASSQLWLLGTTFFVLEGGSMGLSRSSPLVGDCVMIVAGCSLPLILRKQQQGSNVFTIVGPCHCPGTLHGEYIHNAASRAIQQLSNHLPRDGDEFASEIATAFATCDVIDLWARDVTPAKTKVRNLILALANQSGVTDKTSVISTAMKTEEGSIAITHLLKSVLQQLEKLIDDWRSSPFSTTPTARLIATAISEAGTETVFSLASTLVIFLSETVEALRAMHARVSEDKNVPVVKALKDLGLQLGLFTFEALVQIKSAENCDEVEEERSLGLAAFKTGFEEGLLSVVNHTAAVKWFRALQRLAEHHVFVQQHVDTVFEEIVLV